MMGVRLCGGLQGQGKNARRKIAAGCTEEGGKTTAGVEGHGGFRRVLLYSNAAYTTAIYATRGSSWTARTAGVASVWPACGHNGAAAKRGQDGALPMSSLRQAERSRGQSCSKAQPPRASSADLGGSPMRLSGEPVTASGRRRSGARQVRYNPSARSTQELLVMSLHGPSMVKVPPLCGRATHNPPSLEQECLVCGMASCGETTRVSIAQRHVGTSERLGRGLLAPPGRGKETTGCSLVGNLPHGPGTGYPRFTVPRIRRQLPCTRPLIRPVAR
ncbi:hypothetical protein MPH_02637 [Macrophomina phaseolina MS6]|uniref:Uncharacterized protein n=1 Tax=Macrophomina phaseolina (strain MS6) TaxID=1126212 RepID=K2RBW2_MACPH|nr:hypothetical protein MPH_02637 [Macrophomina phaseolina MS6]